ncbi:MAG: gliding motility-associated C-terminal domain-containing protein [Bacteroidetes bacterium]|nr:gliding motility-associated C-terminal domain-containing protein [Bacteroidota bacterium]
MERPSKVYATNTGFLYVTISTNDNCMSYKDSIYIILYPAPNLPSITNYGGIPFTAIPIDTCIKNILVNFPDTIMLVGINSNQGYSTYWQTPNGIENGDSLQVWQPGAYTYNVTAPGGICSKNDCIEVYYYAYNGDSSQCIGDTIYPQIYFVDSLHEATDTVTLCAGESFKMFVADSIDYYNGNDTTLLDVLMEWKITGGFHWQLDSSFTHTFEFHYQKYIADSTSLCNVEVIIHHLISGLVIATISRDFYLKVNQPPADTVVAYAPAIICPGDTELVYLTGCDSFTVAGSGIAYISQYGDSILIYKGGAYSATYTLTDTLTGCSVTKTKTISIDQIETPDITAIPNNALLCPGDSVLLIADTGIAFVWYGPLSTIIGYTQSIYATSPGLYHYVWTDTGGCTLTSNFMEIIAYTSPFITASPGNQLCEGGTITLNISTNDSSVINWHPPLSGSMLTQVIDSAGTYSCDVTVCGITTTLSIVITNSNLQATIVPSGPIQICQNSGTMLVANLGMILYDWQPGGNSQPYNYVTNAGTYTVMITDSFGCTAMDTVIVDTLPTISPPSALQFTICKGDSLLINATNPVAWFSQADLNSLISIADTFQTSAIFNDTIIYIAANDSPCFSDFVPVSIYVNPASLLSILLDDTIICKGDSIILYATYLPQVNYQWSGPGNITATNDSLIIYNFDSTNVGYYFLQFSDSLCPGGLDSIFLNLINSTAITVTENMQLCNGDTLLLIANSVSSTTYSWTSPLGTHTTNDTLLIYPATLADSGTYILNATQFNCLMDSISIPVSVFPVPALPIITGDTIYCMGDTIKLQALVADTGTYLWNYLLGIQAGYTSLLLPANNLTMGGLYTFSITANGCKAQDSVLILVKPLPFVNNFQSIEKCVGDSISINQATQANTTYQWLFNGNNFSSNANLFFNSLQSGNGGQYQLIANMNGCTNISDTFSISVYDYPNFDLGEEKYECINIPIDFLGPIGYANYNWNGLLYNSNNYTANDSGWVILVIDNQGCKTADSTYLHWLDCNIFIPNVFTPNNDNFNDTWQVYYGSVKQISIQILNRWGQQIKILNSVEDSWDGTYKDGAFAPEGVYYYLIDAIDFYNKPKSFTGSLTLIRD